MMSPCRPSHAFCHDKELDRTCQIKANNLLFTHLKRMLVDFRPWNSTGGSTEVVLGNIAEDAVDVVLRQKISV